VAGGAPGGHRARRDARATARRRRAALTALALPVLGAALDELVSSSLGWLFILTAALGGALAAATCSRAGAWWVAYAPPPVVMLLTVAAEWAVGKNSSHATTGAVHWTIDSFPAMAWAEATILVVLALRWFRARRGGPRKSAGRGTRKGAQHGA
jgi:hypothetical protein